MAKSAKRRTRVPREPDPRPGEKLNESKNERQKTLLLIEASRLQHIEAEALIASSKLLVERGKKLCAESTTLLPGRKHG